MMLGGVFLEVFLSIRVFRCYSVFHPLWLVLFHTVNVNVNTMGTQSGQSIW